MMQYTTTYSSPLGEILLAGNNVGLTGLWFESNQYYPENLDFKHKQKNLPVFALVKKWLDIYFSGKEPDFMPPIHMIGSTFELSVWKILQKISYGKTTTYGEIAKHIAIERKLAGMSAQAVGRAVGHNAISIIIPCHRVVGKNGSLTGYAGGIDKKRALLTLEGVNMTRLFVPTKGTAL